MIDKLFMVCVKFLMALGIGFDTVLAYVLYK
jgi:hypothetical protein